jgi:hypothetical protein
MTSIVLLQNAADRLSRITISKHIAISTAAYFAIVMIAMLIAPFWQNLPALSEPIVWLFLVPIVVVLLFCILTLILSAAALSTLRPGVTLLSRTLYLLLMAYLVFGLAAVIIEGWLSGGLWFTLILFSCAVGLWPFFVCARGLLAIPRKEYSDKAREILIEGSSFSAIVGLPRAINFFTTEQQRFVVWFYASTFLFAGALFLVIDLHGFIIFFRRLILLKYCGREVEPHICLSHFNWVPVVVSLSVLTAATFLAKLAQIARRIGLSRIRCGVRELRTIDQRPPIVFLRSFRTDQHKFSLETPGLVTELCDLGRISHDLNHLLLDEVTPFGPVITMGDPSDHMPPTGVSREYVGGNSWQDLVVNWLQVSGGIIVCYSDTAGVDWELQEILKRGLMHKCVVILPLQDFSLANFERLLERLRIVPSDSLQLGDIPNNRLIAISFKSDPPTLFYSAKASREAYTLALRFHFSP